MYKPIFIHSFPVKVCHTILESFEYYEMSNDFTLCDTTATKLKFYRLTNNYCQIDIANLLNISRKQYAGYEKCSCCPLEHLEKIAAFYSISLECLMDDYHNFLYNGGRKKLIATRQSMGLNQSQFARKFNITDTNIYHWENGTKIPTRKSFNKIKNIFKDYLS